MEFNDLSDEELIVFSKKGDIKALETLIERYQVALFNFIFRMINSKEEAEDLLQETFLKVIKNLPKFKWKNFKSYLYKIARNTVIDKLRKKNLEVSLEQALYSNCENDCVAESLLIDPQGRTPEEILHQEELKQKLESAIAKLPDEQKQVFLLHEYSGLTFKEIAAITKCSINTVLSRFQYALKKLRSELKRGGDDVVS